jgi:hypothetical protein
MHQDFICFDCVVELIGIVKKFGKNKSGKINPDKQIRTNKSGKRKIRKKKNPEKNKSGK